MEEDFRISVGARIKPEDLKTLSDTIKDLGEKPIELKLGKNIKSELQSLEKTIKSLSNIDINLGNGAGLDISNLLKTSGSAIKSQAQKTGQEYGKIIAESAQKAIRQVSTDGIGKDNRNQITQDNSEKLESEIKQLVNQWTKNQGQLVKFQAATKTTYNDGLQANVTSLDKVLVTYKNNLDEIIQKTIEWKKVGENIDGNDKEDVYGWVESSAQFSKSIEKEITKSQQLQKEVEKNYTTYFNKLAKFKAANSNLAIDTTSFEGTLERYQNYEATLNEVKTAYSELEVKVEEVSNSLQSQSNSLNVFQQALNNMREIPNLIQDLESSIGSINNQSEVSNIFKNLGTNIDELKSKHKELQSQLEQNGGKIPTGTEWAKNLQDVMSKITSASSSIKSLQKAEAADTSEVTKQNAVYKELLHIIEEEYKIESKLASLSLSNKTNEVAELTNQFAKLKEAENGIYEDGFLNTITESQSQGLLDVTMQGRDSLSLAIKKQADILSNSLTSFADKNAGFDKFTVEIEEADVGLQKLINDLRAVDSIEGLQELNFQAETLMRTFSESQSSITSTTERFAQLRKEINDIGSKFLTTDLSKNENLSNLSTQLDSVIKRYQEYLDLYLNSEVNPNTYIGDKISSGQMMEIYDVYNQLSTVAKQTKIDLIDSLNVFSDKNAGFSKFEMQVDEATVTVEDLKATIRDFPTLFSSFEDITAFNELRQQVENFKTAFTESLKVESIEKSINFDANGDIATKITTLESQFKKLGLTEDEVRDKMSGVNSALKELTTSIKDEETSNSKVISDYDKLVEALGQAQKAYKTLKSDSSQFYDQQKQNRLSNNIQNWLTKNTAATKEARAELERYLDELNSGRVTKSRLSEIATEFSRIDTEMRSAGKLGKSWSDTLQSGMKAFSYWTSSTFIVMKTISSIKSAVSTVTELDTALIDLRKTTTMTDSELDQFYYSANNTAKQMGVTTQEIIEQASAWSRLGYSSADAASKMAEYSAMFKMISPGMDMETATDGLVSVMKAYEVEVDDVVDGIMSKINIIGNTKALSNSDIVEMLTKSSSAMAEANNSLEETIALETAAMEITRDASSVGNAYKTVSMRIRGYDEETEELSEDLENISGTIADLTKTASSPGGISLFTDAAKTEYKSTYQILEEISEIYDELTDKQQANYKCLYVQKCA